MPLAKLTYIVFNTFPPKDVGLHYYEILIKSKIHYGFIRLNLIKTGANADDEFALNPSEEARSTTKTGIKFPALCG